jgi:hypothetical protein
VSPRTFPPAPAWAPDGHRIKAPVEYSRGPDKVWVYGALRVRDGQALTQTSPSRNTAGYRDLLEAIAATNPDGELYVIGDNLSSHKSPPIQEWLTVHPRVHPVFIPQGASWLNLQELGCPGFGGGVKLASRYGAGRRRLLAGLELHRCQHTKRRMSTLPVMEELQILEERGGQLQPRGPGLPVQELDLHAAPERFHQGVIEACSHCAH